MRMKKNIVAFIMALAVILTAAASSVYAAPDVSAGVTAAQEELTADKTAQADAESYEQTDEQDLPENTSSEGTAEIMINVPFTAVGIGDVSFRFPYSDAYFLDRADVFSRDLAKASLGLVVSAFRTTEESSLENQYETYLKAAGFRDIHPFGYDQPTDTDTLSGVIAHKKIGDFTLIAAAPASQGYAKEWGGNMEIGTGTRHEGFDKAAQIMESQIASYIEENHLEGDLKLWLTGFSRGAAVGNLTAADEIESGIFSDVYAYLYAVPRTTKEPVNYPSIFNICGKFDPVTNVPFQAWGFYRYGVDMFLPAAETNSNYLSLHEKAFEVCLDLIGDIMLFDPELNHQVHLVSEYMAELFPSPEEYAEKMQPYAVSAMKNVTPDNLVNIVDSVFDQMDDLDARQKYSSDIFLDYLTYIASQHMQDTRSSNKLRDWAWNEKLGPINYMREHMPFIYISWIFSDTSDEELFYGPAQTRRIYVDGNVGVEVWNNGKYVMGLNSKGEYIEEDRSVTVGWEEDNNVFMFRNGSETCICLPVDNDYDVHYLLDKTEFFIFYDVVSSPEQTFGYGEDITMVLADPGEYYVKYSGLEESPDIETIEGNIQEHIRQGFFYSPTIIMENALNTDKNYSLSSIITGARIIIWIIIILLLLCLMIAVIHRIRKKKHGPYSPLYVIIPHLMIFVIFVGVTRFFTYNMYMLKMTRLVPTAISMLVVFLLALRGLLRNKNSRNLVITAVILAAGIVNCLIYQRSNFLKTDLLQTIIYYVLMAALAVLAVMTFYKGRTKEKTQYPDQKAAQAS